MNYHDFLQSDQWKLFREAIWDHYKGQCHVCSGQGSEVHHLSYRHGLFNPRTVILVCRRCHEVWRGRAPEHLADDNPKKKTCKRIAEIARALGWDKQRAE
jgi:hypothetical protein